MIVQVGRCMFDKKKTGSTFLERVSSLVSRFPADRESRYDTDSVKILYRAFHTTHKSTQENQPLVTSSGSVLTWDGRLDNRAELISALGDVVPRNASDVAIVGAALDRWDTNCLPKLLGDWALSLWLPSSQTLMLAKDFLGSRKLYYRLEKDQATWSTVLDPLVGTDSSVPKIDEAYLAGWISSFPEIERTPFQGIAAVPPASYALIRRNDVRVTRYWDFDSHLSIRYRTDGEYEEHFRSVFSESVRRRLRSHLPVLAELSGGMDSSSIVCTADRLTAAESKSSIETISYYSDAEPDWNEEPYFSEVEKIRGKKGGHINVSAQQPFLASFDQTTFAASPSLLAFSNSTVNQVETYIRSRGSRVLLSGIGGDEFTGGVPTPIPELADLFATARLLPLAKQLKAWALVRRRPWLFDFTAVVRRFIPVSLIGVTKVDRPPAWLNSRFVHRNRRALERYPNRLRFFGALPSFQDHVDSLQVVRRQLACSTLSSDSLCEKRYPFLDRDLLSFLFAIPQSQLLRPGNRRSLLRRAMAGIVPDAVLQRERKAFVSRKPILDLKEILPAFANQGERLCVESLGIVDANGLREALQAASSGLDANVFAIRRILITEIWFRNLERFHMLSGLCCAEAPTERKRAGVRSRSLEEVLLTSRAENQNTGRR